MTETKLSSKILEEILQNYQQFTKLAEGKKPIKPEFILHLIDQLQLFNSQLIGTSEIVNEFNTQYSNVLLDQIKKNNKTSFELQKVATDFDEKMGKIIEMESRIENVSKREEQVNVLLKSIQIALDKFGTIEKIIEQGSSANEVLNKATAKIDQNLTQIASTIKTNTEKFEVGRNDFTVKLQKLEEEKELLWIEKNKTDQEQESKRIDLVKQEEQLRAKEEQITIRMQQLDKEEKGFEERETRLLDRDIALSAKEVNLEKMQKEVMEAQKENKILIEENKLAQDKLLEDMQEATELIAEKNYIEKVEELIKQKQDDIRQKSDQVNKEKDTLFHALDNFTKLLDKTEINLNLTEVTTQSLDNSIVQLSTAFNNFTMLINELEVSGKFLKDERVRYESIGDNIHEKVNELDKQLDEILKLDVLSRYIHQATIEMREAQVSLKVLVDTSMVSVDKNSQLRKDITRFLGTATNLLDSTREQIDFSITSEQKLKSLRQDLISSQFEIKDIKSELQKVEALISAKEEYLSKIEEKILTAEGKLVKTKLEGSLSNNNISLNSIEIKEEDNIEKKKQQRKNQRQNQNKERMNPS